MPDGGTLTLRTEGREQDVVLEIGDTGTGMTPDVAERALEPFFTTKSVDFGTGLGLSFAFGIVRQSGGDLEFTTSPGTATTLRVRLPIAADSAAAETSVVDDVEPAVRSRRGRTILLVEDQPTLRKLLTRIFAEAGYSVVAHPDGASALAATTDANAKLIGLIDVLLTDVVMPGMRGPELARELASLRPKLPTLFMSGYIDGEVRTDAAGVAGGFNSIQKPFTPDVLVETLDRLILDSKTAAAA
jgi:CheY-like chemotaxis protein